MRSGGALLSSSFLRRGGERLRAFGIVAIDGHGLQAELPGLDVGLHDVFDGGFLGHVDGLADGAGKERLRGGHHVQVAAPGDGAAAADGSEASNRKPAGARA